MSFTTYGFDEGSDLTAAGEVISGAIHPAVKLYWGATGTRTAVDSGTPMPVVQIGALPAGANIIGSVQLEPRTSGGLSVFRDINVGTTGVVAKASAGQVFGWCISNNSASPRYVRLYNKATAPLSTDTSLIIMTLRIPAEGGAHVEFTNGIAFSSGISLRATTGVADNNTGAPSANDVIVNLMFK